MKSRVKVVATLCLVGCVVAIWFARRQNDDQFIRGCHYWGEAWPINFWNSFEASSLRSDFSKIKDDGFNTVIIVLPWREYELDKEDIQKRIRLILDAAEQASLKVGVRLAYAHDYVLANVPSSEGMLLSLFVSEESRESWLAYIRDAYKLFSSHPAFSFAFLTWEDFFRVYGNMDADATKRLEFARESGYDKFVREHYTREEVESAYGSIAHQDVLPVPPRSSKAVRLFYDYVDDFIVGTLFSRARECFPGLSLEARVDWDRVGVENPEWYVHKRQIQDVGAHDFVTIYYAPFMFSKNEGEELEVDEAITKLEMKLAEVKGLAGSRGIFIDQFNFIDNTPGMERNARIKRDSLCEYLAKAADVLRKNTIGYALWCWRDYYGTPLYNAAFELGFKGWAVEGGSSAASIWRDDDGDQWALLSEGVSCAQRFCTTPGISKPKRFDVVFYADTLGGGEIECNGKRLEIMKKGKYCVNDLSGDGVSFKVIRGNVLIDNVNIIGHVQKNGMYDENGREIPDVAPGVRELNRRLTKHPNGVIWLSAEFR